MNPLLQLPFLRFQNPALGEVVFSQAVSEVVKFMRLEPQAKYSVMIGSDSNGSPVLDLVSVIAIHRVGNGGRYFWCRQSKQGIRTLRQKIHSEVMASLDLAALFLPAFRGLLEKVENYTELPFDFKIHVDVGTKGETRDLIREVTGMVRGYGYEILVKPESVAATSVADRHVRF